MPRAGAALTFGAGLALAAALAAGGCASAAPGPNVRVLGARIDRAHRPTHLGLPLATGQLILSEAPGGLSTFFSLVPERFFWFTHGGIVVMEGGEPYVYDVSGAPGIPCGGTPLEAIRGGIRRTPFLEYCQANLYAEIFEPPAGVDPAKVASFIAAWRHRAPEFDPYFDEKDHERLFCTEFVEMALVAGGARPIALARTSRNPSIRKVMAYLKVPPETCLPAGIYADPARRVGAIGIFGSRRAALCYFEAKRQLHLRFAPDQRLGSLFAWDGGEPYLRPALEEFLRQAVHLFDGAAARDVELGAGTPAAVATAVRELAEDTFGPPPGERARAAVAGPGKGT